ncbi:hypothetical protein BV22DRAFT_1135926 [Leucogyrophana mollusca]|uniref:Uncharacterized protein n=1 Tax=Leucogyrophana mollusca TaxID=85980 RepID=A0ACB8ATZ6_9AGAM|nr:hypothetical protein BV22DRAFT_1135926 [Leucogyrophana mollusca]
MSSMLQTTSGICVRFSSGIAAVLSVTEAEGYPYVDLGVAPVVALVSVLHSGHSLLSIWAGGFCRFHEEIALGWIVGSSPHDNASWKWVKYGPSSNTLKLIFSDVQVHDRFTETIAACQQAHLISTSLSDGLIRGPYDGEDIVDTVDFEEILALPSDEITDGESGGDLLQHQHQPREDSVPTLVDADWLLVDKPQVNI